MSQVGTIKFFDESRGFGFIKPEDPNQPDAFLHIRNIATPFQPQVGMRVAYEIAFDAKYQKERADKVRLL